MRGSGFLRYGVNEENRITGDSGDLLCPGLGCMGFIGGIARRIGGASLGIGVNIIERRMRWRRYLGSRSRISGTIWMSRLRSSVLSRLLERGERA